MSEWKKVAAESFCDSVRDGTHDTPKQVECGYKLVTAKHISNGQIDLSDAYLISESDYLKINERSKVEKWDVLMSMIGNGLGKSAVVKDNPQYAIKNLALFKIGDEVKAKWLHYYLSSQAGQGFIFNSLQGSGQPFISLSLLRKFPIPVPDDEKVMQDIVSILSRYDSLIENYQKQIKLLEEAAQRLYKEWFVDLHFPGHENTKIIDGVPEGWEKKKLIEFGCTLESGSRPKGGVDSNLKDGIPSVGAENVIGLGKYNYSSEKLITNQFYSQMRKGKIKDRDILIYKDGAYIGRTSLFQDGFPHKEMAINEHVFLLHTLNENYQYYVFFTLYQKQYFEKMQKLNKNAAQPGLNQKALLDLGMLSPSETFVLAFRKAIDPLMKALFNKARQIRLLIEARDRLLPKLMNGEIDF